MHALSVFVTEPLLQRSNVNSSGTHVQCMLYNLTDIKVLLLIFITVRVCVKIII